MLDYLRRICQWKALPILIVGVFLISCTKTEERLLPIDAVPVWLKVNDRFSFKDKEGDYIPHPFFDLASFGHRQDNSVNFFPVTVAGSPFAYDLDLVSGRVFKKHKYCEQKDIWGKYKDEIHLPTFTIGVVPRLLDQLGSPQKVLVFGREKYYQSLPLGIVRSHRVRVVGGFVEQYCSKPPCSGRSNWLSRIVMIAVDTEDSKYKEVSDLNQLKKIVKWDYVKAFVQNGQGRRITVRKSFPAYRIIGEVEAKKTLQYAFNKGYLFRFKELKSMRRNCHKLYDFMWESVRKIRANRKKKIQDELYNYRKKLEKSNVISGEVIVESTQEKAVKEFNVFFDYWYKNYAERFYTCSRFVRPANINDDLKRHWFFTYMTMYMKLEKMGMLYNCPRRIWFRNPLKADNTRTFNPLNERGRCDDEDLDKAFDTAINQLAGRMQNGEEFFKYISYDNTAGGSHRKMHTFANFTGKRLECVDKKEGESFDTANIFPDDVNWEPFGIEYENKEDRFLIR